MSKWQLLWWQCSHAGRDFEGCHCCISHIYHEDSIRYQSHHSPDGKVTISSYSDIFLDGLFRQRILSPAWNMEPSSFTLFLLRVSKQWAKFEGRNSMEFPCFALGHSGAKKEIRASDARWRSFTRAWPRPSTSSFQTRAWTRSARFYLYTSLYCHVLSILY